MTHNEIPESLKLKMSRWDIEAKENWKKYVHEDILPSFDIPSHLTIKIIPPLPELYADLD